MPGGNMAAHVLAFFLLSMANHQIAHIVTTSVLFDDFREWVGYTFGYGSKADYLVHCHLCAGTWIGLLQGLAAAALGFTVLGPAWIDAVILGFAVAMLGRFWNEVLALLSARTMQVKLETAMDEQDHNRQMVQQIMAAPMPHGQMQSPWSSYPITNGALPFASAPSTAVSVHTSPDDEEEAVWDAYYVDHINNPLHLSEGSSK
jgi:hypothetical protein